MQLSDDAQRQVAEYKYWMSVELPDKGKGGPLKSAICREVIKTSRDGYELKVALLTLALCDRIQSLQEPTDTEINDALWLVRNSALGDIPAEPSFEV